MNYFGATALRLPLVCLYFFCNSRSLHLVLFIVEYKDLFSCSHMAALIIGSELGAVNDLFNAVSEICLFPVCPVAGFVLDAAQLSRYILVPLQSVLPGNLVVWYGVDAANNQNIIAILQVVMIDSVKVTLHRITQHSTCPVLLGVALEPDLMIAAGNAVGVDWAGRELM